MVCREIARELLGLFSRQVIPKLLNQRILTKRTALDDQARIDDTGTMLPRDGPVKRTRAHGSGAGLEGKRVGSESWKLQIRYGLSAHLLNVFCDLVEGNLRSINTHSMDHISFFQEL
jgi:hypothetical protein